MTKASEESDPIPNGCKETFLFLRRGVSRDCKLIKLIDYREDIELKTQSKSVQKMILSLNQKNQNEIITKSIILYPKVEISFFSEVA